MPKSTPESNIFPYGRAVVFYGDRFSGHQRAGTEYIPKLGKAGLEQSVKTRYKSAVPGALSVQSSTLTKSFKHEFHNAVRTFRLHFVCTLGN
ncbi:hypothetical protein [Candidatus Puniceispirillum sp.]|uniref:hypothetical protein n=1 Tax=Candidatus Puniceispirillum sp. TaxID=2026719 RepID=UPI003F69E9DA